MSLNNSGRKELPKDILVKVKDEQLRNFLGYGELSNHFILGIDNEELRAFFFEKKCRNINSYTREQVDEIVFKRTSKEKLDSLDDNLREFINGLDFVIDYTNNFLEDYHNKLLNTKQINRYLKELEEFINELNLFIEENFLFINTFLINSLENKSLNKLKNIFSKLDMYFRILDEVDVFSGKRKIFQKLKIEYDNGFIQFLNLKIKNYFNFDNEQDG